MSLKLQTASKLPGGGEGNYLEDLLKHSSPLEFLSQ